MIFMIAPDVSLPNQKENSRSETTKSRNHEKLEQNQKTDQKTDPVVKATIGPVFWFRSNFSGFLLFNIFWAEKGGKWEVMENHDFS